MCRPLCSTISTAKQIRNRRALAGVLLLTHNRMCMKPWFSAVLCTGLLLAQTVVPKGATKKTQQGAANPDPGRIVLDVTRVNMLFTVTDKKGRFITDLKQDDFEVIESKKKQIIQQFTAESDLPLRLAILIDTSNSIRERFRFEQEAAATFINGVVRRGADKAMI